MKLCTRFQDKRTNRSGTGARGTWQPISFTYFASSSPSKFSWHSSFNLASRNTCSFYWCIIFSFLIFSTKNTNTEGKTCYFIAIGKQNFHSKTPVLESLFNNVAGLRPRTLLKIDSNIGFFLWIFKTLITASL